MFEADQDAAEKAARIVGELSNHEQTKTHARHIHVDRLRELGIKVFPLEDDQKLQDAVLTVHHACMHTLQQTPAVKIIENQNSISFIIQAVMQQFAVPVPQIPQIPRAVDPTAQPSAPLSSPEVG